MGTQNGNRFYWVGWVVTLLIVTLGMAASYGALAYQVSEIKANGSIPVHDLDTRVSVLENAMRRIEDQNKEDHQEILRNIEKLDKKIFDSKSVGITEPRSEGYGFTIPGSGSGKGVQ